MRRVFFVGFAAVLGCDPAVMGLEAGGTSSSTGSAVEGSSTTAEDSTTSGAPVPPGSSSVSTDDSTTTGAPPAESSSGEFEPDVGLVRPPQTCNPLPEIPGGPAPVWCDEWIPVGNDSARGARVAVGPDGHVFVTGRSRLDGESQRGFVARYDDDGTRLWSRDFEFLGWDDAHGVAVASNGDVLVGGSANPNVGAGFGWLARLTGDGAPVWELDELDLSTAYRLEPDLDGGFILAASGPNWGPGEPPAVVSRHGSDGEALWTHTADAMGDNSENFARGVAFDGEGNIVAAGSLSDRSRWISKLTPEGNVVWEVIETGDPFEINVFFDVAVSETGDVYAVGTVASETYVGRYSVDGEPIWSRLVVPETDWNYAYGVAVLPGGDIVVVGNRSLAGESHPLWARRYTPDGEVVWDYHVPTGSSFGSNAEDIAIAPDGDIVLVGTVPHGFSSSMWVAKLTP